MVATASYGDDSHKENIDELVFKLRAHAKAITESIDTIEEQGHRTQRNGKSTSLKYAQAAATQVRVAHQNLMEATTTIQQLIMNPADFHQQMSINCAQLNSLQWINHFNIPVLVPLDGSISYTDLAQKARVPEDQLRRVTRMGMTAGILRETDDCEVAHSALSAKLQPSEPFLDACIFLNQIMVPVGAQMVDMTEAWDPKSEKNRLAFNLAVGSDLPLYAYASQHPKLSKRFAGLMQFRGLSGMNDLVHLVHGYDWGSLGKARIVDVGGSLGMASISLALHFASLKFNVQDLPDVINRAKATFQHHELYYGLVDQITFEAHNFFQPQPAEHRNSDVFLLRQILHNWSDEAAANILGRIVEGMAPGARIIIMNTVLPKPGSVGPMEEARGRGADLFMMQAMGGKERDIDEWKALLNSVDPRLKIKGVQKPMGSYYSVIEARFASG